MIERNCVIRLQEEYYKKNIRVVSVATVLFIAVLSPTIASASPRWGRFKRDACVRMGVRQYSSRLWDIQGDWMRACRKAAATVAGHHFRSPTRCRNLGIGGMWGEFDVPDSSCPYWGNVIGKAGVVRGKCVAVHYRKYYARLWDIPAGVTWIQTCRHAPETVAGYATSKPSSCINKGLGGMWGEWVVKDRSCTLASLPQDAHRRRIAQAKLAQLSQVIVVKIGFSHQVSTNRNIRMALKAGNNALVARAVNTADAATGPQSDGYLFRTLTIGATAGAKLLIIGGESEAGAAIDLKGRRPVYAYASGGYDWGPGLAASAGIDVGFWVCQNNKIGGDVWGMQFGVDDLVALARKKPKLDKGASLTIALWFDYKNVFQGFTLTPGVSAGADYFGIVHATTAIDGDDTVQCDGRPIAAR